MTNYWQDAPEWARYKGWDNDGRAWYYDEKPHWCHIFNGFVGGGFLILQLPRSMDDIRKAGQLEKRPEEADKAIEKAEGGE